MNEFGQSGLNLNITIWHCYKHMPPPPPQKKGVGRVAKEELFRGLWKRYVMQFPIKT